jgi:TetR/AcrR family transcriptional regulator
LSSEGTSEVDVEARASAPAGRQRRRASRELLLAAAREVFARRGLEGARVDDIAMRAGVNKQLVYHHFGNKDDLYREVLRLVYDEIRARERALDLGRLEPEAAMRRLIKFSFDYLAETRDFVALLTDENIHGGRHVADIVGLQDLHSPLIAVIGEVLGRGREAGVFRGGLDPQQVYISIAGLAFFYFQNIHTLSAIFGRNFDTAEAIATRRAHVVDLVMHGLRRTAPRPERRRSAAGLTGRRAQT